MKVKKILCVFLVFSLLCCTACTASRRFGMQELSRRLQQHDERYGFILDGVSLYNGYYHIPFSMQQTEDLLLSCKEDSKGQLTQILLTAEPKTAPKEDFLTLTGLLICVFFGVSAKQAADITEEAGLTGTDVLFCDHTGTIERGRYSFTFFSTPLSVTAILTYDDSPVAKP